MGSKPPVLAEVLLLSSRASGVRSLWSIGSELGRRLGLMACFNCSSYLLVKVLR